MPLGKAIKKKKERKEKVEKTLISSIWWELILAEIHKIFLGKCSPGYRPHVYSLSLVSPKQPTWHLLNNTKINNIKSKSMLYF